MAKSCRVFDQWKSGAGDAMRSRCYRYLLQRTLQHFAHIEMLLLFSINTKTKANVIGTAKQHFGRCENPDRAHEFSPEV